MLVKRIIELNPIIEIKKEVQLILNIYRSEINPEPKTSEFIKSKPVLNEACNFFEKTRSLITGHTAEGRVQANRLEKLIQKSYGNSKELLHEVANFYYRCKDEDLYNDLGKLLKRNLITELSYSEDMALGLSIMHLKEYIKIALSELDTQEKMAEQELNCRL